MYKDLRFLIYIYLYLVWWQANLPQLEADFFATMLHELDLEEEASSSHS